MADKNFSDALNQIVNNNPNGLKPQINKKAPINSPALTGTPTAPTPDNDTDSDQIATTEFVQNLIRRLVGAAPETLNTLVELATAINNDPNFANTIVQALDGKLNKTDAATTYATKTDLANVQIDTSNFAKLNSTNTFSDSITLEEPLTIVGYDNCGSNILFKVNANAAWSSEGTFTIDFTPKYQTPNSSHQGGADLIYKNSAGTSEIYLSPTSIELNINSTYYTFKSDGIYKGTTKIAG